MHLGTGGASTRSFVRGPGRSFPSGRGHHTSSPPPPETPTVRISREYLSYSCPISCINPAEFVKLCAARVRATAQPARPKYTCSSRQKVTHVRKDMLYAPAAIFLSLLFIYLAIRCAFKSHICCVHIYFLELFPS